MCSSDLSLGARKINEAVRGNLEELLSEFQIIHICGKGNIDEDLKQKGYRQYEFIKSELPHYLAMTDFVISRAGSNSIFEFLALKKPMLLIPLSREASRGDQILNANSFVKHGYAMKLEEEELNEESFLQSVNKLKSNRDTMVHHMDKSEKAFTIQDMYEELSTMSR